MSEEEIATSYRTSKRKRTQIGILAELNLCSKAEIEKVLIRQGEIEKPSKKSKAIKEEKPGENMKEIPKCIVEYAYDKLDQIDKEISVYQTQIKELEKQYKEIKIFLEGQ